MLKTITKISIGLLVASSISTQAQTFVEANSLTGFNNTFTGVYEGSIAFSDVNNDGKPDVLITGYANGNPLIHSAKLYTNSGTNFIEVTGTPFTEVESSSIAFSDVNSDGKPDVLITGLDASSVTIAKLYTNSGTNFVEVLGTPFDGVRFGSIAFSDVNSDGKPDVLITGEDGSNAPTAKLYTNSGTNFSEVLDTPFTGVWSSSIAFSDVNSDGKPDVLITGGNDSGIPIAKLYTNSGTNFSEVLGSTFTGVYQGSIAFSDVNSDGKLDVLITGDSSNDIPSVPIAKLYTNSGTNFSEVLGTPFDRVTQSSISFSDVNNDGKPDVLITGQNSNNAPIAKLYTNSGTNFSEALGSTFTGVSIGSIAFSDVNRDGKPDVLITGSASSTYVAKLYLNTTVKPTVVVTQPIGATVCSGIIQNITVSATGDNLNYLWSNNATTTSINTSISGTYLVTVTGNGGIVVSNAASLTVNSITQIVTQPLASATVCSGVTQFYAVSTTGSDLMYAWSNGLSTTTSINTSLAGTYMVTVTGTCGTAVSNSVDLIVNPCSVTGISSSIATYNFEIYPNPNSGSFYIDAIAGIDGIYTISAIDGKVLTTGKLAAGKNIIEANLPKGFYLLKVGSTIKKLIIE